MHGRLRGAVDRLTGLRLIIPDTPGLRRQKDDPGRIKPASREAADHSFNFLAAVSLIDGEFGLAQFDGDRWNDPKVCALMARRDRITEAVMALDESASCAELMAAVATESAIGPGRSRSASPS
jgi:hypothetical protein